jgi:hypothetical protein
VNGSLISAKTPTILILIHFDFIDISVKKIVDVVDIKDRKRSKQMLNKELFFERLGITAPPWRYHNDLTVGTEDIVTCEMTCADITNEHQRELTFKEAALVCCAPDMLLELVDLVYWMEIRQSSVKSCIKTIEQATGRKWSEVKEIYEECLG